MCSTDDIQLPQFMVTADGRLKLGDFNRAEFMLYDEEHGEYCKYRNGRGHGDVSVVYLFYLKRGISMVSHRIYLVQKVASS